MNKVGHTAVDELCATSVLASQYYHPQTPLRCNDLTQTLHCMETPIKYTHPSTLFKSTTPL